MAGFAPVAWLESSLPHDDVYEKQATDPSMVTIVQDLLKCAESCDTNSADCKKLRRYVRSGSGIDPVVRPNMWKTLSGADKFLECTPKLFVEIQADLEYSLTSGNTTFFNASTFNKYFLTGEGWRKAQEVLTVLTQLHCHVTFCPIVSPLVCVFMHFMDKEDCFACIDSLFSSKKHAVDKNVTDYCITAKTFQDSLKKWKKPAYSWFRSALKHNHDSKKQIFFLHWLQWIMKSLDFWTMVRVLDNFLLDGVKVFYRIGLVIFDDIYKSNKNKGKPVKEKVEDLISDVAATLAKKPHCLLDRAFKIKGVSKKAIYDLRQKNIKLLRCDGLMMPHIEDDPVIHGSVVGSDLLSETEVKELLRVLPTRLRQLCQLTCIFSTEVDGTSLKTLYRVSERESCSVLLIKTTEDEIFGAFLCSPLSERFDHHKKFFGNGEAFLFRFTPTFKRYTWCGLKMKNCDQVPSFYYLMDDERLIVGGGGGWGLCIEEDLTHGSSNKCTTFDNEPLTKNSNGEFLCVRVEVWSLRERGQLLSGRQPDDDDVKKTECIIDDR